MTEAELVAGVVAGDRSAFAALYDQYAPRLYDVAAAMLRDRDEAADAVHDTFVVVAEKLGQLRDPDRLAAWLFAVLRNIVYRRTDRRRRHVPIAPELERSMVSDAVVDDQLEASELAELVRDAARGLEERDQLLLELTVRQGLEGRDLAAALGVTIEQSYTLVHRMRSRVDRALGAFMVARAGRRDCAELAAILRGWDEQFTVLIRKRVARHVDDCEICERRRGQLVPEVLFGAAPAFALPAALRSRVLSLRTTAATPDTRALSTKTGVSSGWRWDRMGFPTRRWRWVLCLGVGALVAMVVASGVAIALLVRDDGGEDASPANRIRAGTASSAPTTSEAASTGSAPLLNGASTAAGTISNGPSGPSGSDGPSGSTGSSGTSIIEPFVGSTTSTVARNNPTIPGTSPLPPSVDPQTTAPANPTTTARPSNPTTTARPSNPTTTTRPSNPTLPTSAPTAPPTASSTAPPTPPAPQIAVDTASVDLGADLSTANVIVKNTGTRSLTWVASTSDQWFTLLGGARLEPGGSSRLRISFDRKNRSEGDFASTVQVVPLNGSPISIAVRARVEHLPVVTVTPGASTLRTPGGSRCNPSTGPVVANVTDESPIASVELRWTVPTGSGSTNGSRAMSPGASPGTWSGQIGPFTVAGTVTYRVVAVDARGNTGTSSSVPLVVVACS